MYEDLITSFNNSVESINDLSDLYQLAVEENNENVMNEVLQNIIELELSAKKNEIKCFLSNEADSLDCYIEIHAGAGGTESQDWADMLRRMYMKWTKNKKIKFQLVSEHKRDEARTKSSTLKIVGNYV